TTLKSSSQATKLSRDCIVCCLAVLHPARAPRTTSRLSMVLPTWMRYVIIVGCHMQFETVSLNTVKWSNYVHFISLFFFFRKKKRLLKRSLDDGLLVVFANSTMCLTSRMVATR